MSSPLKTRRCRPESGSMLMYSRKKVRYRRDGYCWKKRKDGKTTREDHMKLKVQGVECIYGCYVHSAVLPTFHRRCYWLLQNPDIVLVHYLNVPYPDDSKLAALIPNIAFWTEKKEWTREELLLQLKPMYETPTQESGKENETEETKLNRINISSFIESMIAQLLEKQRYVRSALSNSLECGCGNRKCLGATRCTRPIRRITSAKKPVKRTGGTTTTVKTSPDKRPSNCNERNILKTTAVRKINGVNASNRTAGANGHHAANSNAYYGSTLTMNGGGANTADLAEHSNQPQVQQNSPQLQQLLQAPPQQSDIHQQMSQNHEQMHPKLHQQMVMQTPNSEEFQGGYSRSEEYILSVGDFVSPRSRPYQPNSTYLMVDTYEPNNEMEISAVDKQESCNMNESISTLVQYNPEENEYPIDKYQSDTTDASPCPSYTTITHHQASPSISLTSADGIEVYANDFLDDGCYNFTNANGSPHDFSRQLTQKETTSFSNAFVICAEQYSMQNETSESYTEAFENDAPNFGYADANGNFRSSCSRFTTTHANAGDYNVGALTHATEFTYIQNSCYSMNYPIDDDGNFMNPSNEFNGGERSASVHPVQDTPQSEPQYTILDFAPEWSYCEGGTKLLIVGLWDFQSNYTVLFDNTPVSAHLLQTGVLRYTCPEHAVGKVRLRVKSAGSVISNDVCFEYKKRPHYDENICHNMCNDVKTEQCNHDKRLQLIQILIERIDAKHKTIAQVNKYEALPEKTCT